MASGAKRTRIAEEEDDHHGHGEDHISRLPDDILCDIISLLPTKDGGRTQAIATHWRHLWRSVPLDLDLRRRDDGRRTPMERRRILPAQISGILSSHGGPGRRFAVPAHYFDVDASPDATLDGWLRSAALDGIQELDFDYGFMWRPDATQIRAKTRPPPLPLLPESAVRFSSTLRAARFGSCAINFQNEDVAGGLQLPLLEQLGLIGVEISETSLNALLAGCPVLQSLTLTESIGSVVKRIRIVSPTLRSIGVRVCWVGNVMRDQMVIEDAPSLERILLFGDHPHSWLHTEMVISVISAPKLKILGQLQGLQGLTSVEFGYSVFKGSNVINFTTVLPSVKVLALTHAGISLDEVIAFMKCFPCLENLYIKLETAYAYQQGIKPRVTNAWRQKYLGTLDIRLKKIVLSTYLGNKAHVNFATFFVLNARALESMVLNPGFNKYYNKEWIENQKTLLLIEERASRRAQIKFVHNFRQPKPFGYIWYNETHDLSTADPFVGFKYWATDY